MSNWHFGLMSPEQEADLISAITSDTTEKVALLLLGVLIAQVVNYLGNRRKKKRLIKSLLEELELLLEETERVCLNLERQLQVVSVGGIEQSHGLPIKAYIFDLYYKDVVADLNKHQRISYQLIHSHREALNEQILDGKKIIDSIVPGDPKNKMDFLKWGEHSVSAFVAAKILKWHIKYHLKNNKKPALKNGDATHQSYVQYMQSCHDEAISIRNNPPPGLSQKSFEKIYDPRAFGSNYQNIHGNRI